MMCVHIDIPPLIVLSLPLPPPPPCGAFILYSTGSAQHFLDKSLSAIHTSPALFLYINRTVGAYMHVGTVGKGILYCYVTVCIAVYCLACS